MATVITTVDLSVPLAISNQSPTKNTVYYENEFQTTVSVAGGGGVAALRAVGAAAGGACPH